MIDRSENRNISFSAIIITTASRLRRGSRAFSCQTSATTTAACPGRTRHTARGGAGRAVARAHAHRRPASAIDYPAAASQQHRRTGGGGPRHHSAASTSAATEYLCAPPVCCLLGPYHCSVHVTRARIFFIPNETAERATVANEKKKITNIVIKHYNHCY